MKLNRIAYKLGFAGLAGLVLSLAMSANQMTSEIAINRSNDRAEVQQNISDRLLEADIALRRMQLSMSNIRLAKTPADVETEARLLQQAEAGAVQQLDASLNQIQQSDGQQQLKAIKALAIEFGDNAKAVVQEQLRTLEILDSRRTITEEWRRAISSALEQPAMLASANRAEIVKVLHHTDALFNMLDATTWRFGATSETEQKLIIERLPNDLNAALSTLRDLLNEPEFIADVDFMNAILTGYYDVSSDAVANDLRKRALIELNATPTGDQAIQKMRAALSSAEKLADQAKMTAKSDLSWANRVNFVIGLVVMASLVASIIFGFISVSRPLMKLNGALGKMAGGELDVHIPGAKRGDEIGDIAKTVVVIRENAAQRAQAEAEALAEQEHRAQEQRKRDMHHLAHEFESAVGQIVDRVSTASAELEGAAGRLTSTAEETERLTTFVAAASEQATANVQSVASASEQMASSINEISRQVQDSTQIAGAAVQQAHITNDQITQLAQAASRIGDVVELINTIAGQTNLLALNATIEAARAGEAGRGFAVVASEVKALAEQTARATGEISQQIAGIQSATDQSVGAIQQIGATIAKMSEIASAIALAVEQQGSATQDISSNVHQAAQGTTQVSANINDVQRGASQTGAASTQVLNAARMLSADSDALKRQVAIFLESVRAA
jgi:methyl-accepting chemotaxis protein